MLTYLLRTLRGLNISTWADLTTRARDGTRSWLDIASLLPTLTLPAFPPTPQPWPGYFDASRPGQFWRLTRGLDEWAWGGIYQVLTAHSDSDDLQTQRWSPLPPCHNRLPPIIRTGLPLTIKHTDFVSRCTHRLLVNLNADKGNIIAEFPDLLGPASPPPPTWTDALRHALTREHSWSVYTDASWRALHPPPAQTVFGLQGTHAGRGALFLSADSPDWCSYIIALRFEIPPTLQALGGTAHVAELLAIHAGLLLLHSLHLRGTVYSDRLAAVKKITRRWTPGRAFQDTGAPLVTASRAMHSDSISLQWIKGHPERSEFPHSTWTRQQWGIFVADAITKNREIGSLPHSPIPSLQILQIPFSELCATINPFDSWQWADHLGVPPLGNLRSTLSHHRVLAYRAKRDKIRAHRGAPPIWANSHQVLGSSSGILRTQPLRKRVQALRTLWDLRWHGENRSIATRSCDPEVSACPICHRFWSQAHVICNCPSTSSARLEGSLDLTIAINRLPPRPMLELGRKFKSILIIPNQPDLMARRWAGQWDHTAIEALRPEIALCSRKQLKVVLGHIGRITSSTAAACWRDFSAMARELSPTAATPAPPPPPALSRMGKHQP